MIGVQEPANGEFADQMWAAISGDEAIWRRLRRASAVAISTLVLAHCASANPSPDVKPVDHASDGERIRLELLGRYSIDCNTSVWNGTPCPPEAPRAYTLPSNPVRVSNSSELIGALDGTTARDIVLADGTYDNSTYFHAKAGHRAWAEHLGKVTLTAGIYFDKAPRSEVHGIRFNVNSNAKTHGDSIIHSRPPADYLLVTDSWFEGHMVVRRGLFIQGINGAKAQRLVITHFTDEGLTYRDTKKRTNFDIFPTLPAILPTLMFPTSRARPTEAVRPNLASKSGTVAVPLLNG